MNIFINTKSYICNKSVSLSNKHLKYKRTNLFFTCEFLCDFEQVKYNLISDEKLNITIESIVVYCIEISCT